MPEIQQTAQAEEDLVELWIYIAQDTQQRRIVCLMPLMSDVLRLRR